VSTPALVALIAVAIVGLASAIIGSYGVRVARNTSDFLVASRTVGPVSNASAISGEYLSTASFLGIAGLILREGADALWYPIAFVAGYLALVLFVAAPLRRSGAYTVPDFAEVRLESPALRRICTVFVLVIGWLYLLPQLQGAGLALTTLTTLPAWSGIAGVGIIVLLTVVGGGMRSITFVQAFQYWIKLTALAVPVIVVLGLFLSDARTFDRPAPPQSPRRPSSRSGRTWSWRSPSRCAWRSTATSTTKPCAPRSCGDARRDALAALRPAAAPQREHRRRRAAGAHGGAGTGLGGVAPRRAGEHVGEEHAREAHGISGAAVGLTMFGAAPPGWLGVLLYRPSAVTVPAAFLTMAVVSRFTRSQIPPDVDRSLLLLHAPERLGLTSERRGRPHHGW
jgi:hypothetical protein